MNKKKLQAKIRSRVAGAGVKMAAYKITDIVKIGSRAVEAPFVYMEDYQFNYCGKTYIIREPKFMVFELLEVQNGKD